MNAWKSIVPTVVVTLFGFAGGYWGLQSTIEEQLTDHRELDIKMVDVALAILAGEKGSKPENQSVEARRFAVQILRQYSKLDETRDDVKNVNWDEWAESIDKPLQLEPYGGWLLGEGLLKNLSKTTQDSAAQSVRDCLRYTRNNPHCLNVENQFTIREDPMEFKVVPAPGYKDQPENKE